MGLLGSIGKFFFGGKKKNSQVQTSGTSAYQPYAPTIPYINDYLGHTNSLYNGGAPMFSPLEQSGYDRLQSTVNAGTPGLDTAMAENTKTAGGGYLSPDSNPYLRDVASRLGSIASGTSLGNFGPGRTDSGLSSYSAGKAGADAAGELYMNNYNAERGRMSGAVGMAPSLEATRYLGPQAEISAGQNVSSRPFDLNQQRGGILQAIGSLGQQGQTQGKTTGYGYSPGLIGGIVNSFTNKLFPGVTPW